MSPTPAISLGSYLLAMRTAAWLVGGGEAHLRILMCAVRLCAWQIDEIYLPEALDQRRACGCPAIRNDRLSADNKADSVRRFWMRSGPKPADPSRCTGGTRRKCEAECDGMPTAAAFLSCMNSYAPAHADFFYRASIRPDPHHQEHPLVIVFAGE